MRTYAYYARFYFSKEESLISTPIVKRPPLPKVNKDLVNENIPFQQVLVVDEEGKKIGVMKRNDAIEMAYEKDLDLFCIAPSAKPPVCKIMNFSKYKFEKKKAEKEAKSKQTKPNPEKEIQITSFTSQHDIETKANQAIKLMAKGYRLKLVVFLKGRMVDKIDVAQQALQKMIDLLLPYGSIDKQPTKEGRQYFCYMSPIKKKN